MKDFNTKIEELNRMEELLVKQFTEAKIEQLNELRREAIEEVNQFYKTIRATKNDVSMLNKNMETLKVIFYLKEQWNIEEKDLV